MAAAVTPWITGLGLLVSFTASAGTDTSLGSSLIPQHAVRLVPPLPSGSALIGNSDDAMADAFGSAPLRPDLKRHEGADSMVFPQPQRSGKGDAAVAPGPSFARSARSMHDSGRSLMRPGLSGRMTGLLAPGAATWNPEETSEPGFLTAPEPETDGIASAPAASDGSTPAVPRAVALSSTTPAPADATPVEVAAATLAFPSRMPAPEPEQPAPEATVPDNARHRYADLIVPEALDREQRCLAEAVYFEARSEPEAGQAAVAQVVLNRVKSGLYPTNVCGVVYQNRHRYMGCQFSFACEGKSLRIADGPSWQSASRIAKAVIEGRTYLSEVGGATHYHADYVKPGWSRRLKKMDVIGRHIFYSLKRGQT